MWLRSFVFFFGKDVHFDDGLELVWNWFAFFSYSYFPSPLFFFFFSSLLVHICFCFPPSRPLSHWKVPDEVTGPMHVLYHSSFFFFFSLPMI